MEQQNKKSKLYFGAFVLLFLAVTTMLIIINKNTNELELHRDNLIADLQNLEFKYEVLINEKEETDSALLYEKNQVAMLIDSVKLLANNIEKLNWYKYSYFKLKKEKEDLIAKADSLIGVNNMLAEQKAIVEGKLNNEEEKNRVLTEENNQLNETVALGKILDAQALIATGVAIYSSGKEKEKNKAKRVTKIKACFTLGKNRIHPAGEKAVYLIVSNPLGKVISPGLEGNSFNVNGDKMIYSQKQVVNYQNTPLDVCMYVDESLEFTIGNYQVQVYTENAKIGESTLTLY